MSSNSPFRVSADITGEQCAALDRLSRKLGRSRNALIRAAIDAYLATAYSPAEAARDSDDGRDSPPSAPASASRVASAGVHEHPWRRGKAVSARRVPGGREC